MCLDYSGSYKKVHLEVAAGHSSDAQVDVGRGDPISMLIPYQKGLLKNQQQYLELEPEMNQKPIQMFQNRG